MNEDPGLCRSCDWSRTILSHRGSTFWLCRASVSYPGMPKYPPLPVLACRAWTARGEDSSEGGTGDNHSGRASK